MEDKKRNIEVKEEDFISYLDDDNTKKDRYVEIIERDSFGVKFQLGDSIITLPWHRILKIKEKT